MKKEQDLRENMHCRAFIMVYNSVVNEDVSASSLLAEDIFNAGIKKEKLAELGKTEPSVNI
jgi:hypothetical protein